MSTIKTVGDLRELMETLPDEFELRIIHRVAISEEKLSKMSWPYPWESFPCNIELDDVGYSDKVVCFGIYDREIQKEGWK